MPDTDNTSYGTLYIVATPIGNLEDITLRALRLLNEVDLIAAEDTRHTNKLLTHYKIDTPVLSCFRENEFHRSQQIIDRLHKGNNVALVSDAGTPCISDPGSILVGKAHDNSINVSVIPGPSALVSAFSLSGLAHKQFEFVGFLPNKKSERRKVLRSLKARPSALTFYESPKRVLGCLQDILENIGDRHAFVARELTKIHEEYFRGNVSEVLCCLKEKVSIKGEFVLIVAGCPPTDGPESDDLVDMIKWYRDNDGNSLSYTVKKISNDLGVSRSMVYKEALKIWD